MHNIFKWKRAIQRTSLYKLHNARKHLVSFHKSVKFSIIGTCTHLFGLGKKGVFRGVHQRGNSFACTLGGRRARGFIYQVRWMDFDPLLHEARGIELHVRIVLSQGPLYRRIWGPLIMVFTKMFLGWLWSRPRHARTVSWGGGAMQRQNWGKKGRRIWDVNINITLFLLFFFLFDRLSTPASSVPLHKNELRRGAKI